MKIGQSDFIDRYTDEMVKIFSVTNPEWDEEDVRKIIREMIDKDISVPDVILDNNYINETKPASLISVFDWLEKAKPNIAGNGTFYKNQSELCSPNGVLLDDILNDRKKYKKKMFSYDPAADEYAFYERKQANEKVNANSWYGGSGNPKAAFYSKWSGPATTLTAQSVISTAFCAFEAFFADNYQFINSNELFHWINEVLSEDVTMDDWIEPVDKEALIARLRDRLLDEDEDCEDLIRDFVNNLSIKDVTRIYYKNQLLLFIDKHPYMKKLYRNIFDSIIDISPVNTADEIPSDFIPKLKSTNDKDKVKEYNAYACTKLFMNPNEVPEEIEKDLKEFTELCLKYCNVDYMGFDRVHRIKNFKRRTVVVVDTDSNMLNCEPFVTYSLENIVPKNSTRPHINNCFIAVNTIAYVLTEMTNRLFLKLADCINVKGKYRERFKMKNEFLFMRLLIANVKKRYISSIILREGNLYDPVRIDIKGMDFKKSQTADKVAKYYTDIITDRLLEPEVPDIKGLFKDIKVFRTMIKESIENGDTSFLQIASAKEPNAYDDPYKMPVVRGMLVWNEVYPTNQIRPPEKVKMIKLKLYSERDLDIIKDTNPDVYEILLNKVFHNSNKKVSSKGVKYIAIPSNVKEIPQWIRDCADYTTITNDIISQFKSVLEMVGNVSVTVGSSTKGVQSDLYTNIVKF